jgi:propionyl-CoA carboxylase alpha chain
VSLPAKVLIPNRGEIAVRVVRSLRRLGVRSVVAHHPADADTLAVREADEAVALPTAGSPVAAYLDIEAIVAACERTGADAVHPGFGFLSENAYFAEALAAASVTFIGPPPAAMRAMADKLQARRVATAAGVPVVPGSEDAVADADEAVAVAERIGFPVLLKASAGGGGKGMRVARGPQECAEAFERAAGEARASFGDGRLFVERYLERPRHIEIQVLADAHGAVVHLGERECSIQRRHQKLIEECPSPFLDEATRAEMAAQAVALARAVGYVSAGTVEMIVDAERRFHFLEMNTRLQVEHPVTELVYGVDIVAEQVRIAAGEPLRLAQEELVPRGHAIECRVCAEDPDAGFLPATGTLGLLRLPSGPGLRVDHGVQQGDVVSAAFDPMLAKVIAHGATRQQATDRVSAALGETVLLGVQTNAEFLQRVLGHPAFAAGETHTGFLDEHAAALAPAPVEPERARALLATAALASPRYDPRHALPEPLAAIGEWRP